MANWKKTSEELPESGVKVLFILRNGDVIFGTWHDKTKEWWDDAFYETEMYFPENVIAWCPIPEFDLDK